MQLTPLDIYQKQFRRKKLNGLDPQDVEEFLFQVAEGMEALLHENARLAERAARGEKQPTQNGTDAPPPPPQQDARHDLEQARREARRLTDEAGVKAKAAIDAARDEARRIVDAAQARAPQPPVVSTQDDSRARKFAIEYQSILVKHLAQVTHHLGDVDDDRSNSANVDPTPSDHTTEVATRP